MMRNILSALIMSILSVRALESANGAQAQDASWAGIWGSQHGELRLIQIGDYIYGDYRNGIIEGILDRASGRWRATFRNPDGAVG